jgi:hypothetical protein
MKRVAIVSLAVTLLAALFASTALAADPPETRVLALYFHRTERCPTCQKMGTYSEEAVKQGYAKEVKGGQVAFYFVDFQDKKNAKLAKGYDISGPALIVAKVKGKKVKEYKDLEDIWTNANDKKAFISYVQENISAYLK